MKHVTVHGLQYVSDVSVDPIVFLENLMKVHGVDRVDYMQDGEMYTEPTGMGYTGSFVPTELQYAVWVSCTDLIKVLREENVKQ